MGCLVAEDEVPFIAIALTFFVGANALTTLGRLLVALVRLVSTGRASSAISERRSGSLKDLLSAAGGQRSTYASLDCAAVTAASRGSGFG